MFKFELYLILTPAALNLYSATLMKSLLSLLVIRGLRPRIKFTDVWLPSPVFTFIAERVCWVCGIELGFIFDHQGNYGFISMSYSSFYGGTSRVAERQESRLHVILIATPFSPLGSMNLCPCHAIIGYLCYAGYSSLMGIFDPVLMWSIGSGGTLSMGCLLRNIRLTWRGI